MFVHTPSAAVIICALPFSEISRSLHAWKAALSASGQISNG